MEEAEAEAEANQQNANPTFNPNSIPSKSKQILEILHEEGEDETINNPNNTKLFPSNREIHLKTKGSLDETRSK